MTTDDLDALNALRRRLRHTEAVARLCAEASLDSDAGEALAAIESALEDQGDYLDAIIKAGTR